MASMPMQLIDPDSRIDPSQLPYERGYAAGVADTEEKYKVLVVTANDFDLHVWTNRFCPSHASCPERLVFRAALRQLEEKP